MAVKVFIAGIIQGSIREPDIHRQDYREVIREAIRARHPQWEVYCPFANHSASLTYPADTASRVFFDHIEQAADADLLIAYLPEASMGTAIEMFEAYRRGTCRVVAVSPLAHNWSVRFCSHALYATLEEFLAAVHAGEMERLLLIGAGGR